MRSGLKMQELVKQIDELVAKVHTGQISQDDLDTFVETTAALHHKAVILRYKSFENHVFGHNQPLLSDEESISAESQTAVPEAQNPVSPEIHEPETVVESKLDPEEFVEAEIELSQSHVEDEPTFDLFSLDLDAEQEISAEHATVIEDEGQTSAIEMEAESATEAGPAHEETTQGEKVLPVNATASEVHADTALHAIYQRIDRPDDSFASRFPVNKIDTLSVAFGFNERLQTINELFGGSSEAFNTAVQEIEQAASKDEARRIVTRYAHRQHWNSSDDLAVNFAKKVDQLYV